LASVRFSGSMREEARAVAEPFEEIWNLCKPVNGSRLAARRDPADPLIDGRPLHARARGGRRPEPPVVAATLGRGALAAVRRTGCRNPLPSFPDLRVAIQESGMLGPARGEAASALLVKLKPGALPLLLARDDAARGHIEIEGTADLAGAVDELFRRLGWDYEEDLSRVFGDVVAHRLASGGKAFAEWSREAVQRLAENLAEYWVEEQPLLVRPAVAEKFGLEVDALREQAARLEQRIERLESPASAESAPSGGAAQFW